MLRAWSRSVLLWFCVAWPLVASGPAWAGANTRLMVLYFDNNTGDKQFDHLSKGLADMMITDLAAVNSIQVVEREKLEALLKELKLQRSKYFDPKTTQKIGRGAGAGYAVSGAFLSVDPSIRLDVRVIRIDTGTVLKTASVTGSQKDFFDLQQKLTTQLVTGLPDILSASDAEKARSASAKNRVTLAALVDYGKGLEARDQGDLPAASEHLQKVVAASPEFALGKARYMQIMRDLYAAKNARNSLLSDSEQRLLAHIQQHLASGRARDKLPYRVLLGQYHLTKIAAQARGPAAKYRDNVRAYVDNQRALFSENQNLATFDGIGHLDAEDFKLAEELGIKQPGRTFGSNSPSETLRHLNAFLVHGTASIFDASMPGGNDTVCFYKLDPSYPKIALQGMEQAIAHIERFENSYREREVMRSLREWANSLVELGRPEDAIAKLQYGLKRFPKSDEFDSTEQMVRDILESKPLGFRCKAPR